jgi:hypothetical protein
MRSTRASTEITAAARFAPDSPLEEAGFEPSVPHARNNASFDPASRNFRTDHRLERITGSSVATPGRYAWAT